MKNTTKYDISNVPTLLHSAVRPLRPRLTLPAKSSVIQPATRATAIPLVTKASTTPPVRMPKKHRNYRHMLYIAACQLLYAIAALALGGIAYYYLAAQPVYRVVALVVIGIAWSNAASATARKKTIDMLETIEHPAIRIWRQKQNKTLYTENTNVFLQAIKSSFLGKDNEIH